MPDILFQAVPLFTRSPKPPTRETRLIASLRRQSTRGFLYTCPWPTTIRAVPTDALLYVNGDLVVEAPVTIRDGDLLIWLPGEVC